ncbi:unnamed protein product [Moneuplotes crassus]|uniref:Eukaryotic translation initiation factor 5A n=1 Tax=Euplotes crassus TaxID=5936 RepID=A0AAD2D4Y8_EUPCR|nr:unnamed protein product [Moneuplotes crassus]
MEGGAHTEKVLSNKLTKGSLVMVNEKPCKVIKTSKAKPGKHGSAKIILVAIGILDDKKVEQSFASGELLDAPIVDRTEYPLLGLEDDFMVLQDESGEEKRDVKLTDRESLKEVREQILKFEEDEVPCLVMVMKCCGEEVPVGVREDKDDE